jgi:hypothetical protein
MAAILAPHHGNLSAGFMADRYGNDPFVWSSPFVWSHCHARSRSQDFGHARTGPFVFGMDAVFFVSIHPQTRKLVCDCVFVIDDVLPIRVAEESYPPGHPVRHYHFDQNRNKHHEGSSLTRVADTKTSFVPHPPAPIGRWIEAHVAERKLSTIEYFKLPKRRNVRVVVTDAQGIYDRLVAWCRRPGHRRLSVLPPSSLQAIRCDYPAEGQIAWDLCGISPR